MSFSGFNFFFSEGCIAVKDTDTAHFGYIDRNRRAVIKPQVTEADPFSEGLAAVKIDGKIGYIDHQGNISIAPQFEASYAFSEGLASVEVAARFGFIDTTGRWVIKPQYASHSNFHNGLALVEIGPDNYAYIDTTGKKIWAGTEGL